MRFTCKLQRRQSSSFIDFARWGSPFLTVVCSPRGFRSVRENAREKNEPCLVFTHSDVVCLLSFWDGIREACPEGGKSDFHTRYLRLANSLLRTCILWCAVSFIKGISGSSSKNSLESWVTSGLCSLHRLLRSGKKVHLAVRRINGNPGKG